jgi:hypothetical protein
MRRRRAAGALAAGALIAGGTRAYAVPIMYINPPGPSHFNWAPTDSRGISLDMQLPASGQDGLATSPSSFTQDLTISFGRVRGRQAGGELCVGGLYDAFLLGIPGGDLIPGGGLWNGKGYTYYASYGAELPENRPAFLGVRFNLGSGFQYGWIEILRTGRQLDAVSWGYDTTPGVPVRAGFFPEPGTLALLALGAAAVCRRRTA